MSLSGTKIAVIVTNDFEDVELVKPVEALRAAGAIVTIVSNESTTITGKNGTEVGVDMDVESVSSDEFRGLLIPGGVGNPDTMRTNKAGVSFIRSFFESHKPVAAICHGPWLLVEAGVVEGRKVTSWPSIKTDLKNAGAEWVDEEVVTDNGLVTSRNPSDIPAFIDKMIEEFDEGKHEEQTI